jgi:O-antigen ligase
VNTVPARTTLPRAAAVRLSSDTFWMAAFLVVVASKVNEWLPGLTGVPMVKITFGIALIVAFRAGKLPSPVHAWSLKLLRPAIAFQVLGMVTILWTILKSTTLLNMISSAIYLIAMVVLVKITLTPGDLYRLLKGLALAGVLLALGTLATFTGGRAQMGFAWNANDIAYSLVTLLPLVLAQRLGRSLLVQLLVLGGALLMVVATLVTGSRGGLLGLAVVVVAYAAFPLAYDKTGQLKPFRAMRAAGRLIPLAVLAVVIWTHLPHATTQRLATIENLEGDYNMKEDVQASRMLIWRRDLALAVRRPIGYGMGTSVAVDGLLGGGQYRTAHNSLIEVFVELGVLGLALYLTVYYRVWRGLAAVARAHAALPSAESAPLMLQARALSIAFAGNFAVGFFLSQAYSGLLWMLVAVCAALVRMGAPDYGVIVPAGPLVRPRARQIGAKWV